MLRYSELREHEKRMTVPPLGMLDIVTVFLVTTMPSAGATAADAALAKVRAAIATTMRNIEHAPDEYRVVIPSWRSLRSIPKVVDVLRLRARYAGGDRWVGVGDGGK